jgi:predicted dithiol-disulfide oxidoreductase (DUF899 family)
LDEAVALVEYHSRDKATHKQARLPRFTSGELHGVSVFRRDSDSIDDTDSTCARGTDRLKGTHNDLHLTPLGRQEDWEEPVFAAAPKRGGGFVTTRDNEVVEEGLQDAFAAARE